MLIRIDSGSSHSFASSSLVQMLSLKPISVPPQHVKLLNCQILIGDKLILISDKLTPNFQCWCTGYTMEMHRRVLDLDAYDPILGYYWLQEGIVP